MEQTITGIEILPRDGAVVTPRELLEDFADHTQRWLFLERETEHYASERGQPSVLLRHHRSQKPFEVNFIFVASDGRHGAYNLRLVAPDDGNPDSLDARDHQRAMEAFRQDFEAYLAERNQPLRLDVTHVDDQPTVPAT